MNPVVVRNVKIGEGMPKICIPIVGKTEEEIVKEAKQLCDLPMDLAEWRADWFGEVRDCKQMQAVLSKLRDVLGETPILFTFRTAREGGERECSREEYRELNRAAIESGYIDLVDVEVFGDTETAEFLISVAHEFGVKVIGSYHDFEMTPTKDVIVEKLRDMQEVGADILKMAVMPGNKSDVVALLEATEIMVSRYATKPVVTMSMSKEGMLSRIAGEIFGSAITFGSAVKASAPGQIPASELKETIEMIHHLLENR